MSNNICFNYINSDLVTNRHFYHVYSSAKWLEVALVNNQCGPFLSISGIKTACSDPDKMLSICKHKFR